LVLLKRLHQTQRLLPRRPPSLASLSPSQLLRRRQPLRRRSRLPSPASHSGHPLLPLPGHRRAKSEPLTRPKNQPPRSHSQASLSERKPLRPLKALARASRPRLSRLPRLLRSPLLPRQRHRPTLRTLSDHLQLQRQRPLLNRSLLARQLRPQPLHQQHLSRPRRRARH